MQVATGPVGGDVHIVHVGVGRKVVEEAAKAVAAMIAFAFFIWTSDCLGLRTTWRDHNEEVACRESNDASCSALAKKAWANWPNGGAPAAAAALEYACARKDACACAGLGFMYGNAGLFGRDAPSREPGYFRKARDIDPNWPKTCPKEPWWDWQFYDFAMRDEATRR